jgi:hypothetical protein
MNRNLFPGMLPHARTLTEMPSGTAATAPRRSQTGGRSPLSFVRCVRWLRPLRRSSLLIELSGRVEQRGGSLGHAASPRFPCPLIKPDGPISGIRLSGWLHRRAHGGSPRCTRLSRSTPSSPKTWSSENVRVPRPCTLCRLLRKCRTRSRT